MANENHEMPLLSLLPEDCLANIISLTSPKDACRAAAVSLGFRSAAESDTVWERFLPPDYKNIIAGSTTPVAYSTKKELYLMLCDSPLLVNDGKMSFKLSRHTGKKCYMVCARELEIAWKDTPIHWKWTSLPESRFAEVAQLLSVFWLDIHCILQAQMLSPNTNYAAYLVFRVSDNIGLELPSKASVKFVEESTTEIETSIAYIAPRFRLRGRGPFARKHVNSRFPSFRTDGWEEIELGDLFIAEGDTRDVQIQLFETERLNKKKGLIVEGIELRPQEAF